MASTAQAWSQTRWQFAGFLGLWCALGAVAWWAALPLGHDEAAYAIEGARLEAGATPWMLYRPTGMAYLARFGLWLSRQGLGEPEQTLRLVALATTLALPLSLWWWARTYISAGGALLMSAVLITAHPVALRASELLNDLTATGLALWAMAALAGELEATTTRGTAALRPPTRWRIPFAATALAACFYLRYGNVVLVMWLSASTLLVWPRAVWSRRWEVLAALGWLALLLSPHWYQSFELTGSITGIVRASAKVPHRAYIGEGLVTYLTSNPLRYFGALLGPLMWVGAVWGAMRFTSLPRPMRWLYLVAAGQLVAVGLLSHGQMRYVLMSACAWASVGAFLVVRAWQGLRWASAVPRWSRVAPAVGALLGLGMVGVAVVYTRALASARRDLMATAALLREDLATRRPAGESRAHPSCVLFAERCPQLSWYTRCDCHAPSERWALPRYATAYGVWLRPDSRALDALLADVPGATRLVSDGIRELYRLPPPVRSATASLPQQPKLRKPGAPPAPKSR